MNSDKPHPPPLPIPLTFSESRSRRISALASGIILLFYAGFFRWAFAEPGMAKAGGVVSLSFIASVPFACGAISVAIARWSGNDRWLVPAIIGPCGALMIGLFICVVVKIEAMVCVIMAAPILIGAAILGGLLAHALLPKNAKDCRLQLTFAVFLPFITATLDRHAVGGIRTATFERGVSFNEKIIDQIQVSILEVIRARAEKT